MIKLAVIVAAGLGTRLKHRTTLQPKGFLELDGLTLIDRSLSKLRLAGINEIVIGTGYHSQFYENLAKTDKGITCIKSDKFETTSSMYTLFNMKEHLNDDFLLLESDLLFEQDALSHLLHDQREDIVLGSGTTHSDDEVYLQTNKVGELEKVSKDASELSSIYAELVGISKISKERYKLMNDCFAATIDENPKMDYEHAMALSSAINPLPVLKINDLIWCEIDDEQHLKRAVSTILPKIKSKENKFKLQKRDSDTCTLHHEVSDLY